MGFLNRLFGRQEHLPTTRLPASVPIAEPTGLHELIQEYIATRTIDLTTGEKWITAFQKYGEEALPHLERAIRENWNSHPAECIDLIYAIGWIGGSRAIAILSALKDGKLTDGTILPVTYGEHMQFVPTAFRLYEHLSGS